MHLDLLNIFSSALKGTKDSFFKWNHFQVLISVGVPSSECPPKSPVKIHFELSVFFQPKATEGNTSDISIQVRTANSHGAFVFILSIMVQLIFSKMTQAFSSPTNGCSEPLFSKLPVISHSSLQDNLKTYMVSIQSTQP